MAGRRSLIEGLDTIEGVDPQLAEDFILNRNPRKEPETLAASRTADAEVVAPPAPPPIQPPASQAAVSHLTGIGRVPVGARVRTELAAALKRASLERQLQGIQPNSVQEILEESLELWLLKHGHLR
jgi:hypothetical protein